MRSIPVTVAGLTCMTMLYGGCAALDQSSSEPTAAQQARAAREAEDLAQEQARQQEHAEVSAAFPGVDAASPVTALDLARANFAQVRKVQIRTSASDGSHAVADDVVLTPSGVYAKSWLSDTFVETVVVNDGRKGYVRTQAKFWVSNGMSNRSAKRAAGRWVQTKAVAGEEQTLPMMRERLVNEFTKEWGAGTGEVSLTQFRGAAAIRVDTAEGYVIAAGEPLLPAQYVFDRNGKTSQMRFTYANVAAVTAPEKTITLDAVVAR